jgi:hypothetical protein
MKDARVLRERWKIENGGPCDHPRVVKEYHLGSDTGDYVCTRCGETGYGPDWHKRTDE